MRPIPFTPSQKSELHALERGLREAVQYGHCDDAKNVTKKLHKLLSSTGHAARLLKIKNSYFECVLESGDVEKAKKAFEQICERSSKGSRVNLEATALLAICYLRQGFVEKAEPLMQRVLKDQHIISSAKRRREFRKRIIARFDEEGLLAASRDSGFEKMPGKEINREAQKLAKTCSEFELLSSIGNKTPDKAVVLLLKLNKFSAAQLSFTERKLLGFAKDRLEPAEIGQTFFGAIKRVIWRSLCDPSSEIYKAWFNCGLKVVLSKAYIGTAVATALAGLGIGARGLAVAVTAMIIKGGIEVYCDRYRPHGVMIDHR